MGLDVCIAAVSVLAGAAMGLLILYAYALYRSGGFPPPPLPPPERYPFDA